MQHIPVKRRISALAPVGRGPEGAIASMDVLLMRFDAASSEEAENTTRTPSHAFDSGRPPRPLAQSCMAK